MSALGHGDVIGIFGGGQLGRMLALAAARLGLDVHIYAPQADSPAARVSARQTVADFDDLDAVRGFASACAAVTFEFENVPAATLEAAAEHAPVRPGSSALAVTQDRVAEKTFARTLGAGTVPFAAVDDLASLEAALDSLGAPSVLKTRRLGYDGKGQAWIRTRGEATAAWAAIGAQPAILEGAAAFSREVSIVAARGADGAFAAYDLTENVHVDGVLRQSVTPAPRAAPLQAEAEAIARAFAERLDYVGVFAIEFFEVDGALLVNEVAPRVHNSGHWTLDTAACDQFENHIRAVAGLKLGATTTLTPATMTNLFGPDAAALAQLAAEPGARLHLYGKRELLAGRKTGHVTRLTRDPDATS